jgi:hypothetical protein
MTNEGDEMKTKKRSGSKWIQKALGATKAARAKKRGALHRQLGIPLHKVIPLTLLKRAAKNPKEVLVSLGKSSSEPQALLLGRRARFALTLRKLHS